MPITTHSIQGFLRGIKPEGRIKNIRKMPRVKKIMKVKSLKLPKQRGGSLLKLPKISGKTLKIPAVNLKVKTPKIKTPRKSRKFLV